MLQYIGEARQSRYAIGSPSPNPSTDTLHKPFGISLDDDVSNATEFSLLIQQLDGAPSGSRSLKFTSDAALRLVGVQTLWRVQETAVPEPVARCPSRVVVVSFVDSGCTIHCHNEQRFYSNRPLLHE